MCPLSAQVIRLYQLNANMSDFQYLWIDLFVILPLAVYMSRTGPCSKLSVQKPQSRLISVPVLGSVLGQSCISTAFQVFAAFWTFQIKSFHCDDTCPGPKHGRCSRSRKLHRKPRCTMHTDQPRNQPRRLAPRIAFLIRLSTTAQRFEAFHKRPPSSPSHALSVFCAECDTHNLGVVRGMAHNLGHS